MQSIRHFFEQGSVVKKQAYEYEEKEQEFEKEEL